MANEKRLMCVDDFKKKLCHYCNTYMSDEPCEPGECWVYDVIAQTDTVDAVEVVHGRCNWCNGDYHTKIMATAIRYHSNGNMDGYEMKVKYCPNCGAKMDGGKDKRKRFLHCLRENLQTTEWWLLRTRSLPDVRMRSDMALPQ